MSLEVQPVLFPLVLSCPSKAVRTVSASILPFSGPDDKRKNSKWHYTVGVCKDGTDMMVSHYLKSGTREEVCEYVKTEENKSKTIESVKKLSDNVDERWS